jgi:hypothetical protein
MRKCPAKVDPKKHGHPEESDPHLQHLLHKSVVFISSCCKLLGGTCRYRLVIVTIVVGSDVAERAALNF